MTLAQAARRGRKIVLGLGAVFVLLATAGFVRTGWGEFGQEEPVRVLGVFGVSTLLNIVHTFVGLVALLAALRGAAGALAPVATVAFTAMAVFGATARLFGDSGDPLNQTWWNVGLYLLSAAACAYVYSLRLRAT
jgi:fermentation-respiration switch protein FrsA (DUF1100 family)